MTVTPISKVDAARRQLDVAIRMFFDDGDSLAVHTLACAAFRLLFDLAGHDDQNFTARLSALIGDGIGWKRFNGVANFLKHADSDPDAVLEAHDTERVEGTIGMACILHHRLTGRMTPPMRGFDTWMHVRHPNELHLPQDDDPEFERKFRESLDAVKAEGRSYLLGVGRALIEYFEANPDAPGYGAPRTSN